MFISANYVYYDSSIKKFRLGPSVIINTRHIVSFNVVDLGKIEKEPGIGKTYYVDTVTHNGSDRLTLTGQFFDNIMENSL